MRNTIFLILAIVLVSVASFFVFDFQEALPVEEDVDLMEYMGTWYSVYEFPAWFQQGCECTAAEYSYNATGEYVDVKNTCLRDGQVDSVYGTARPMMNSTSRLQISFDSFPYATGDYYIINVSDDYETAMVGTPDRRYLWILSREPTIDTETLNEYKDYADELGFNVQKLQKVNHDKCSIKNEN